MWRVALDALWTPAPWAGEAPPPSWEYSRRVGSHLVAKLNLSDVANFSALDAGCAVASVHEGWQWQGFIYGPLSAALLLPLETRRRGRRRRWPRSPRTSAPRRAATAPTTTTGRGSRSRR